jgi:hypothetical protein
MKVEPEIKSILCVLIVASGRGSTSYTILLFTVRILSLWYRHSELIGFCSSPSGSRQKEVKFNLRFVYTHKDSTRLCFFLFPSLKSSLKLKCTRCVYTFPVPSASNFGVPLVRLAIYCCLHYKNKINNPYIYAYPYYPLFLSACSSRLFIQHGKDGDVWM